MTKKQVERKPTGFKQASKSAAEARTQRALDAYQPVIEIIRELDPEQTAFSTIAEKLNGRGFLTTAGKPFTKVSVHRVIGLFDRANPFKNREKGPASETRLRRNAKKARAKRTALDQVSA